MSKTMSSINKNLPNLNNQWGNLFHLVSKQNKLCFAKLSVSKLIYLVLFFGLATTFSIKEAQAEPVADVSAGTKVTQNGNQFDISGGTQAGNNLFHSFEKLGLNKDQIANFLSNPNIHNILGRVTGGDASFINGLIQVTGGNSNLFLINPAGIIFGQDATLNLPASFTATTANGIQVGDFWFDALGSNNYTNLVGEPNGFAFVTDEPGSIINAGNLSVSQGETINLVGGLVINTGTLEAPEGKINIISVPEKQLVKISPEGSLLSLGLPTTADNILSPGAELITPLALPELLTGGDIQQATGVEVAENGTIKLTGSDTAIPSDAGTTIASGNLDVSGDNGGKVNVLGDRVGVVAGNIDASGTNGGGTILIGGDYKGQGEVPNALRTFIDGDSVITADAVENGNGGNVIAWADEVTAFYGDISAIGGSNSGNGGFVEVSGEDGLVFEGNVDLTAINGIDGTLLLDPAKIRIVGEGDGANDNLATDTNVNILNTSELPEEPEDGFTISIDALVRNSDGELEPKNVILEATESIVFERNTLVDLDQDSFEDPKFIGALIEKPNELLPDQDIPFFQSLTLKVEPIEDQKGSIDIRGSFAVKDNLILENTNGDINIDLQLPETVNFRNDNDTIESQDTNEERGSVFVGIDSLRFGVDPRGAAREMVGKAEIRAPQGSVKLQGGITLNADSDLTIEAQQFTATDPVTIQGTAGDGIPGRIRSTTDFPDEQFTYNIGVVYYGGDFDSTLDEFDPMFLTDVDSAPNVQLRVLFDPDNAQIKQQDPASIPMTIDPDVPATADITITLLGDERFDVDDNLPESGLATPIQRFARISTDGSIGGGSDPLNNKSFTKELIEPPEPPKIPEPPTETTETTERTNSDKKTQSSSKTFQSLFCADKLKITNIAGSDKVKATCRGQTLAFVFTQPTDENGNPLPITEDLFPELLTEDEIIEIDENTSFDFWIPQDEEGNPIKLTFGKFYRQ